MEVKIALVLTTLFSIGFLVLPSATSLFAGQHLWYDLSYDKSVPCVKCHADVYDELKLSANHSMVDGEAGLDGGECLICHRANASITYAEVNSTLKPGKEAHAATITNCGYCHFNSSNPFNAPVAGGFGQSDLTDDTGVNASHYSFVIQSENSSLLHKESESCVACHTTVNITMNFTSVIKMKIAVNNTYDLSQSYWDIESINAAENRTYQIFVPDKTKKGSYVIK